MECNFTLNARKLGLKLKKRKNRSDVLYSKNHNFRTERDTIIDFGDNETI